MWEPYDFSVAYAPTGRQPWLSRTARRTKWVVTTTEIVLSVQVSVRRRRPFRGCYGRVGTDYDWPCCTHRCTVTLCIVSWSRKAASFSYCFVILGSHAPSNNSGYCSGPTEPDRTNPDRHSPFAYLFRDLAGSRPWSRSGSHWGVGENAKHWFTTRVSPSFKECPGLQWRNQIWQSFSGGRSVPESGARSVGWLLWSASWGWLFHYSLGWS